MSLFNKYFVKEIGENCIHKYFNDYKNKNKFSLNVIFLNKRLNTGLCP